MSTATGSHLLDVEELEVTHAGRDSEVSLVRSASFQVRTNEIVCLVGESGSGKSVTAKAIMGLIQNESGIDVSGSIRFSDQQLVGLDPAAVRRLRGRAMTMVFQEPMSSLDPVFTVQSQLAESLARVGVSGSAARPRMSELLSQVGIYDPERVLRSHPHQLSGGMSQRVMIAMALAAEPRLLIADEPTTALDVTVQAQILSLIERLRDETAMAVLLVTHDMGVAAELADRVIVMYAGRVVEDQDPRRLFRAPRHPYTEGLLACIPPTDGERPASLPAIPGSVPDPRDLPTGCAFHPRCGRATDRCIKEDPPLIDFEGGRLACWNPVGTVTSASVSDGVPETRTLEPALEDQ